MYVILKLLNIPDKLISSAVFLESLIFSIFIYFQHLRKLHKFLKKEIEKNVCSQAFFSLKVNFDRKCLS